MKITVAIPTYNNLQQLEWCVNSLFKYTNHDDLQVVIVDNGGKGEVEKRLVFGDLPTPPPPVPPAPAGAPGILVPPPPPPAKTEHVGPIFP